MQSCRNEKTDCPGRRIVYLAPVQATITPLQRKATKPLRAVVRLRRKITLSKSDRAAALEMLRSIGPVPLPPRQ
jgi:hypothetical protein